MTGKTKARIIALRIWVLRRDKRVMRLLLLTFLLCAAVVFARARNGSSDQSEAETIKSIRTDEKIFAMTVVVTGDEKTTDLEALANLCGDFGVSPTYFITPDWAEENAELCAKLSEKGGALGLYIEDDLRGKSRSTVLKYISEENERFYVALGQYPRYVRAADGGTGTMSSVLDSFGQYLLASGCTISPTECPTVQCGDIAEVREVDERCLRNVISATATAIGNGISPIAMKSFLYDFGSPVDASGRQYENGTLT